MTLGTTRLTVAEGASSEYTVRLATEPTGAITVTASVASGAGVSVSPPVLTFTSGDYASAQTVTVSASEDEDAQDESVSEHGPVALTLEARATAHLNSGDLEAGNTST